MKKQNLKSLEKIPRRTKSNKFYGLTRVDEEKPGGGKHGWILLVNKIFPDGKQKSLFDRKFFSDEDYLGKGNGDASIASRDAAMKFRDKKLKEFNEPLPETAHVVVRKRDDEIVFLKSKTRSIPDMYGICRDLRRNTPSLIGWKVRVKGKAKHFSDNTYGGIEQSLAEAKKFRDGLIGIESLNKLKEEVPSVLRLARIKAGVSQDLAGKWMDVGSVSFSKMERGMTSVSDAFIELFCDFANKKLDPDAEIKKFELTDIRIALGKTQSQMSKLVKGSNSQAPWVNWEIGKTKTPGWVVRYVYEYAHKMKVI
jgi:DNA-binding XRE family transcriptional regulator